MPGTHDFAYFSFHVWTDTWRSVRFDGRKRRNDPRVCDGRAWETRQSRFCDSVEKLGNRDGYTIVCADRKKSFESWLQVRGLEDHVLLDLRRDIPDYSTQGTHLMPNEAR